MTQELEYDDDKKRELETIKKELLIIKTTKFSLDNDNNILFNEDLDSEIIRKEIMAHAHLDRIRKQLIATKIVIPTGIMTIEDVIFRDTKDPDEDFGRVIIYEEYINQEFIDKNGLEKVKKDLIDYLKFVLKDDNLKIKFVK